MAFKKTKPKTLSMARGGAKVERGAMASWDQGLHLLVVLAGEKVQRGQNRSGRGDAKTPTAHGITGDLVYQAVMRAFVLQRWSQDKASIRKHHRALWAFRGSFW